jgi:4'-phosphopantetheinyl transferase
MMPENDDRDAVAGAATALARSLGGGHIVVVVHDLDLPDARLPACRALLDPHERARVAALRFERDRRRFCVSRARLRQTLAVALGLAPGDLRFAVDDLGKPYLPGQPHCLFNQSHAGGLSLVAVSALAAPGVDLEPLRELDDRERVANRVFSPRERAAFEALPPAARTAAFYRGWTRKEAMIKATGEGLRAELTAFTVTLGAFEPATVIEDTRARPGDPPWQLWHLAPRDGYVGALAIRHRQRPDVTLLEGDVALAPLS